MSSKNRLTICVAGGIAVCAALLYVTLRPVDAPEPKAAKVERKVSKNASKRTSTTNRVVRVKDKKELKVQKEDSAVTDAWVEERPEQYRKLAQSIVDASDHDDLKTLQKLVKEAQNCPDDEIRQRMVDSLAWFDQEALVELTGFLTDRNPEVAQSAFNAWDSAVDMIDSEPTRLSVSKMAMKTLTDKDSLQCVAAKFEAAEDRKAAITALIEVVQGGSPEAAQAAKDAYEFIAEEAWQSPEQAKVKAVTIDVKED